MQAACRKALTVQTVSLRPLTQAPRRPSGHQCGRLTQWPFGGQYIYIHSRPPTWLLQVLAPLGNPSTPRKSAQAPSPVDVPLHTRAAERLPSNNAPSASGPRTHPTHQYGTDTPDCDRCCPIPHNTDGCPMPHSIQSPVDAMPPVPTGSAGAPLAAHTALNPCSTCSPSVPVHPSQLASSPSSGCLYDVRMLMVGCRLTAMSACCEHPPAVPPVELPSRRLTSLT
jgi:hypothetical protein